MAENEYGTAMANPNIKGEEIAKAEKVLNDVKSAPP